MIVFRLDQRLGNGIMLLPLLRAMKQSKPDLQIYYFIHHPVANLFKATTDGLVESYWAYNQPELLARPWRYLSLIRKLRREKLDVAFSSHNPDNFSLSQAIFGRLLKPRMLVGFDARDSRDFYDLAISSTTEQHYAESMLDLWRTFDSKAECKFGGFSVPKESIKKVESDFPERTGGVLIWLGATKSKVLDGEVFERLYKLIEKGGEEQIHFAAAPADEAHIADYPEWIRERTLIWQRSLMETSAYFSCFRLFVSADTGPMHLAVALRIPTLTLFIKSNMIQYGYQEEAQHYSLMLGDESSWAEIEKAIVALNC